MLRLSPSVDAGLCMCICSSELSANCETGLVKGVLISGRYSLAGSC